MRVCLYIAERNKIVGEKEKEKEKDEKSLSFDRVMTIVGPC